MINSNFFKRFLDDGFTLVELIISVALLVIIMTAMIASQTYFLSRTYMDTASEDIIGVLRQAQLQSRERYRDSAWGVHLQDNPGAADSYTFFRGQSYAARDTVDDLKTDLAASINFSNINLNGGAIDVPFEKGTGKTSSYGTFYIENQAGEHRTISVSAIGLVESD